MNFFNFYSSVVFCLALCLCGCEQENTETRLKTKFEYVDESFDVNSWKTENQKFDRINIGGTKINLPPPRGFVNGTETFLGEGLISVMGTPTYIDYLQYFKPKDIAAILDDDFAANVSGDSYSGSGSIELVNYHPDRMTYSFSSTDKELAVFSEIYYDGWKAYVDGQEVPISRANYVLRAIEVPAGDHDIIFEFESETYNKSGVMANIGSVGILLFLLAGLYLEARRKEDDDNEVLEALVNESKED